MKRSGLKRIKGIEDFDWTFNPKIPRDKIMRFFESSDWVKDAENIVFIGPLWVWASRILRNSSAHGNALSLREAIATKQSLS